MRSFNDRLPEFAARGLHVVGVSTDTPDVNVGHREKIGVTFPLLSDPQAEVIARYDLLHEGGAPDGANIARPAEFLIDSAGTVRWVDLTESAVVRTRPDEVLKAYDRL